MTSFEISKTINLTSLKLNIYSFVEVDFYTKTVIIVKDFDSLNIDDFSLLLHQKFDLKKLKDLNPFMSNHQNYNLTQNMSR